MSIATSTYHHLRQPTLFAGVRKTIRSRDELGPLHDLLKEHVEPIAVGPLMLIFRFDTPVDGFDAELGYPVSEEVLTEMVRTHTLREMHFFGAKGSGTVEEIRKAQGAVYQQMNVSGLSPELELVEIYHQFDPDKMENNVFEVHGSFLAWPEIYFKQLTRVLGETEAKRIWEGGEQITPFTPVDERVQWVSQSISRLKEVTTRPQQFDILSRVALVRPTEEIQKHKQSYLQHHNFDRVVEEVVSFLENGPSKGFPEKPQLDGLYLRSSKVPRNRQAYDSATTHLEKRKTYCFCSLVREASDPRIDPIFCYRAAGWDRQFWEEVLDVDFVDCTVTKSILKGDNYCAWTFELNKEVEEEE